GEDESAMSAQTIGEAEIRSRLDRLKAIACYLRLKTMTSNSHKDTVRSSFTVQAQRFADPQLTLSNPQYLQWILNALALRQDMTVVDFACGTGIMARAIAPFVKEVIG